jgi:hypothetical protein
MRKLLGAVILLLIGAIGCDAQTTVSGTITDAGSVAWASGSYNFQTVSGTSPQNVNGTLDGSGHYSVSITSPNGTYWTAQFCPLATAPCYTTGQFTIQGGTQTIAPTPPAISISLINPPAGVMRAYTDGEITSAVVGSLYYNIGAAIYHGCTTVSGQTCTVWANVGAGGTSTWPTLPGGTNTSSGFVCGTGCSITPTGGGVITATNGGGGGINPPAGDIGGSAGTPTVVATHLAAALPVNQGGTGTTTPSLIAGTNVTITGSWPNQTVNSSGGGGGAVSSFTGDGTLITNSASTGAVTATLGTAVAHRWWGNPTGSTTAPGYNLLTASDIPTLNQSTTGNAATATTATTASNLVGCSPSTTGDFCYWTGSAWSRVSGNSSGTNFLSENSFGTPSWNAPASTITTALLNSLTYYSGAGTTSTLNGIPGSTSPDSVVKYIGSFSTGGVAQTPALFLPGVPGRSTASATDTILVTDRVDRVQYTNGGAVAVTVPAAGTTGFANNFAFKSKVTGSGTVATFTPGAGTCNTGSTCVLTQGQDALFSSQDNVNYTMDSHDPPLIAGTNITLTRGDYGLTVSTTNTTVAAGTAAMGTGSIASAACATVVTVSATGVLTTDVIQFGLNGDITGVTGYIPSTGGTLYIYAYPTANNVNFKACNNTSGAIVPGAVTLNWRVAR